MNPALQAIQQRRGALRTSFAEQDGRMFIAQTQDCTQIAEWTKEQQAIGATGTADMKHAARIPDVILNQYMNEHGVSYQELMRDPAHIRRIVNDPKNAAFRIWKGRV